LTNPISKIVNELAGALKVNVFAVDVNVSSAGEIFIGSSIVLLSNLAPVKTVTVPPRVLHTPINSASTFTSVSALLTTLSTAVFVAVFTAAEWKNVTLFPSESVGM